jgi:hypothetical protein
VADNFVFNRWYVFLATIFNIAVAFGVLLFHVWCIAFNPSRGAEITLGFDRLWNVAMGQGNETVSSWEGRRNGPLEKPINWLFSKLGLGENHCDNNIDEGRQ